VLEWVLFLSQLGLWVMVIQLYRRRNQDRRSIEIAAGLTEVDGLQVDGAPAGLTPLELEFLDTEAVNRMSTIRSMMDELEERIQVLQDLERAQGAAPTRAPSQTDALAAPSEEAASTPPTPSSVDPSEALTAFLAPPRRIGEPHPTSSPTLPFGHPSAARLRALGSRDESGDQPSAVQPEKEAATEVQRLAADGLDSASIARTTGRQIEEVNLLLHLAKNTDRNDAPDQLPIRLRSERRQA
jgi:hypothetical protein